MTNSTERSIILSSKFNSLIIAFLAQSALFNNTFAGHAFVTRNVTQDIRHPPLVGVDVWARDYMKST